MHTFSVQILVSPDYLQSAPFYSIQKVVGALPGSGIYTRWQVLCGRKELTNKGFVGREGAQGGSGPLRG